MNQEFQWEIGGINMDNFIEVNEVDEENTDILHRRFVQRYREEKGRLLTMNQIYVGGIFVVSLCVTVTIRQKNMSIK